MNRTITCLAAAAAILLATPSVMAANAVEEAQKMVSEGKLDAALKRLDAQLKSAPQDAEARFMRGLVLTRLNRSEEAIKAFADITRDYPQLPEPYNNLAVLYAQQGDYEKARDALEAALATHPSYATAHENLGDIYAALAGAAYNRALLLDQGNQTVRSKLSFLNRVSEATGGTQVAAAPAPGAAVAPAPQKPAPAAEPVVTPPAVVSAPPPAPVVKPEAPVNVPTDEVPADRSAEIFAAVNSWASAWSAQDVDAYLSHYASDFQPEGGVSRSNWEALRRERVARPSLIRVSVVDPSVSTISDGVDTSGDRVRVTFRQEYESNNFGDTVTKVLEMRNEGGWKITREYTR